MACARYLHVEEIAFFADGQHTTVKQIEVTDLHYLPAAGAAVIREHSRQPDQCNCKYQQNEQESNRSYNRAGGAEVAIVLSYGPGVRRLAIQEWQNAISGKNYYKYANDSQRHEYNIANGQYW